MGRIEVNIKILVATHKFYKMPSDPMYLPIHLGRKDHDDLGFIGDNTGDNIAAKDPHYAELSALYWGWKNLDVDVLGLVHYRRLLTIHSFLGYRIRGKWNSTLTQAELENLIKKVPIILPNKRRYYIETNESHYVHAQEPEPLKVTRQVIYEKWPSYAESFERVMKRTWAHMFNIFIMRKPILDEYCSWLFNILFELEKRINTSDYPISGRRLFGYVSEPLLDVWLENVKYDTLEFNLMFMENQHWPRKILRFLKRKYFGCHE